MADVSKIKLPSGTTYTIKDNNALPLTGGSVTGPVSFGDSVSIDEATIGDLVVNGSSNFIQGVKSNQIVPFMSKTYTDVIGTANSWAGATFFFGAIKPTSWDDTWRIRYKINVYVPNHQNYRQMADVMVTGSQGAFKSYYSFNTIGQYYICYYHVLYRLKQAGFNNGYGHSLGLRFYSAYNPIDTNYKRTIEIEIYELTNCTFEFYDECLLYASIPGTGSTNYDTYSELDFVNNGLQETGDSNDPNYQNRIYYAYAQAKEDIYRYQIVFRAEDGNLIPASDANNSFTIGAKNYTTTPFNPFAEIYYLNSSNTYTVGNNVGNAILYRQYLVDLRYAFDVDTGNNKLIGSKPVYLTARPQSNGMAVLEVAQDSIYGPIVQTLPSTDDGLIYIYLGQVYPETNPYRMELMVNHPIYWYKDGQVRPYVREPLTINGHTVESDVPSNAQFTDTITTVTTTGSGNAVTAISASNGALTVTKGTTFATGDTKVTQTAATASSYTYWRPLVIGMSSGSSAGFTPSTTTDTTYTFNTLEVQPSTGSIRVGNLVLYKGSYTATLTPVTLTANRTITIPDKAGTMALTSDITSAIEDLPEPMIFKGSVGTSGTITSLPTAAASNEGHTYKVITALSSPSAKVGDTVISNGSEWVVIPSGDEPSGTVTSVAASNATNGGLTISGSPITSSGTITIGHSNVLTSAQTTQAVYPIKIDKNGHISAYGTAVTIPTVPTATGSSTTGVSIADHSTTSIYGVSSSTTSVTGVSGSTSVYGVKSGTNSTTTASKASGANGTAPTLGTAISIYGVKSGTNSTTTASHVKSGGNGTAPTLGTAISLIGVQSSTTTASKVTVGSHSTDYGVTAAGSGSFTQGSFSGGSLTFTMDTTDTKKLKITFTAATHGADSHTHTAPTLGSKVPTVSASDVTVPIKNASATSIPNVTSAGSASNWVFEDITVPIRADSATSIPNVTSVGSASTWSFTDVTVPIRADSATTVPTAASSATTVPIKNGTATTVITSKTHSVTDNGHTHTI